MSSRTNQPPASFWGGFEVRIRIEWITVTVVLTALTVLLSLFGSRLGINRLDFALYDTGIRVTAQRPASDDIIIIAIDDSSIARLGHWPWRRSLHADLLHRLPRTRAIGIDILFSDPNTQYPEDDAHFADAIAEKGNVVLPFAFNEQQHATLPPLPMLAQAAAAIGFINIWPDADGAIRSLRLSLADNAGNIRPHMISALLDVDQQRKHSQSEATTTLASDSGTDGPNIHRRLPDSPLLIPFAGPPGHFAAVPYIDVLSGNVDPSLFEDKFVLIGSWGTGLGDAFPTPLSHESIPMSGVEILANALQSSLEDRWIHTPPYWANAALAAIPVLIICLILRRRSPRHAFFSLLIAISLIVVINWLLLYFAALWVPMAASLAGVTLAYPVWSWRSQEVALKQISLELNKLQSEQSPFKENMLAKQATTTDESLSARVVRLHGAIEQLRNLRQFFSDSLDATPDATLIFDTDGIIRFSSQKAKNYALKAHITVPANGETAHALLSRIVPDAGLLQAIVLSLTDTRQRHPQSPAWSMWHQEGLELRDAAGNDILLKCVPIRTAGGQDAGAILTLIDISPLRQAQRKREETLRFISHDMRSPQNSILALAQLQKNRESALPEDELLARIQHYASKTLHLVDGFVQLARAESSAMHVRALNLVDIVMNASDECWALAQQRNIQIILDDLPDQADIQGEETMLARALGNILDNAIKYSANNTTITCRLQLSQDKTVWHLTIQDQGRGIAESQLKDIFQPFTRVDETVKGNPAGTGLGLAFVQAVIGRHGGTIEVKSTPNVGSVFTIALPNAAAHSIIDRSQPDS